MKRQYKYLISFVNANYSISWTYVYAESKTAAREKVRERFKRDYRIIGIYRVNITDSETVIDCYKLATR